MPPLANFWTLVVAAVGSAVAVVMTLVWKEASTKVASAILAYGSAFFMMPVRVNEIDKRLGKNGKESVFELLHSLQDASKATLMKERLRADREGVLMWHSDSTGHCVWASTALQALVGYSFDEKFRGMAWLGLFFSEDRDEIGAAWASAIGNGDPFILRTRYEHADGSEIPVRLEAHPLPGGAVIGLVSRS